MEYLKSVGEITIFFLINKGFIGLKQAKATPFLIGLT